MSTNDDDDDSEWGWLVDFIGDFPIVGWFSLLIFLLAILVFHWIHVHG